MTKMLLCTMVFTMVFGVPAFAGSWEMKSIRGWRYLQDDGSYAFWKIPYHDIDFTKLTEIKND